MSQSQAINCNILKQLFPYIKNKGLINFLRIDNDSIHYISTKEIAEKITDIISSHMAKFNISKDHTIITDAFAGVGGDTISFSKTFSHVYAIEVNKLRFDYLNNNLHVYGLTNVNTYHQDFINVINKIENHNAIFIDPPWGGANYKNYDNLRISVGNDYALEDVCNTILFGNTMKKNPQILCLKLPKNYDIYYLYTKITNCNIYLYDLTKMYIIIIENIYLNSNNLFFNDLIELSEQIPIDDFSDVITESEDVLEFNNFQIITNHKHNHKLFDNYVSSYVNKIINDALLQLNQKN